MHRTRIGRFLDYLTGSVALLLATIVARPANVLADVTHPSDTSSVDLTLSAASDVDLVLSDDEEPPHPE